MDAQGNKHVLGMVEGEGENASSSTALLEDPMERGFELKHHYLFVIDGSKPLGAAINPAFGRNHPLHSCRQHKIRNVCNQLPDDLADQVKSVMKAAYNLPWPEGMAKLRKQAGW